MNRGIAFALASAALFGVSTPLAKLLVGAIPPLLLAGLLYAGSGVGLLLLLVVRQAVTANGFRPEPVSRRLKRVRKWVNVSGEAPR